jgi:hypothetical protein
MQVHTNSAGYIYLKQRTLSSSKVAMIYRAHLEEPVLHNERQDVGAPQPQQDCHRQISAALHVCQQAGVEQHRTTAGTIQWHIAVSFEMALPP